MKLKNVKFLYAIIFVIIVTSCDGTFVPDPIVPVLPKYSSQGYNAAGAMVNGVVRRSLSSCGFGGCSNRMNFYPDYDSVRVEIRFEGQLLVEDRSLKSEDFYFSIFLDSVEIASLEDLKVLSEATFDLGVQNYAEAYDYEHDGYCTSTEGRIFFDKVVFTGLDYIVSGTFGFVIEGEKCSRLEVFSGRFDYAVSKLF